MNAATTVSDAPAPFHPASSLDYVPREQLAELQSERLRQVVARVHERVPVYRQRMHKHGLTPAELAQQTWLNALRAFGLEGKIEKVVGGGPGT